MRAMETIQEKAAAASATISKVGQLAIDKTEESARLNLASMRYLSDVGIRQLRSASGVRDFAGARRFAADSLSLSGEVTKVMLDSYKAWLRMAVDTREKMGEVLAGGTLGTATGTGTPEAPRQAA